MTEIPARPDTNLRILTRGSDAAFASDDTYGLTKREWFAGMAMAGLAAMPDMSVADATELAVAHADELIRELNGENE